MGVSECGVCGGDGCSLTVVWSEVTVTCGGSVSGYVLTVTPPTSDCQSSPQCVMMDDSAMYTLSGSLTQYRVDVNESTSMVYNIDIRAVTCNGTLDGDVSELYMVNLRGTYIQCGNVIIAVLIGPTHWCKLLCNFYSDKPRDSQAFSYYYQYNISTFDIEDVIIDWPRVDVSVYSMSSIR